MGIPHGTRLRQGEEEDAGLDAEGGHSATESSGTIDKDRVACRNAMPVMETIG